MLFKTEGRAWYKCQYVYVQNLNLKFRTKGNIVLHKANNETVETEIATQPEEDTIESNPSLNLESDNGWEDYLVEREDGILSPVSTDIAERAQSSLQCASTGLPVEPSVEIPVMISKKRKVEAFLEATTPLSSSINRSSKSQKNDVCLNNFMSKCTDIGSNITRLLNENLEKDKKENVSTEDYLFMLSMKKNEK